MEGFTTVTLKQGHRQINDYKGKTGACEAPQILEEESDEAEHVASPHNYMPSFGREQDEYLQGIPTRNPDEEDKNTEPTEFEDAINSVLEESQRRDWIERTARQMETVDIKFILMTETSSEEFVREQNARVVESGLKEIKYATTAVSERYS